MLDGVWSLFKLLLSASYWRMLFRAETWRSTVVAARRAHKDKRAWTQLARTLYLLLVPVSVVVLVLGIALIAAGGAGVVLIWVFVLFMMLLGRVGFGPNRKKQPDTVQSLGLTTAEPALHVTPELRREIADLCLLHAVLADRAGSERFVQTKALPEGVEVTTRRAHLDLLRERGVYDRLRGLERDLLLLPDGHWPMNTIHDAAMMLEPLRLLRWVLRVDNFLPTVGSCLAADYKLSGPLIQDASPLYRGTDFIGIKDLAAAVKAGEQYFYRCFAEGVLRGFFTASSEEETKELRNYASALEGKENADLLLGTTIVSRATEGDVRLAGLLALRRTQVLGWVRRRMEGAAPAEDLVAAFHLQPRVTLSEEADE